jgi:hypothetical protein
LSRVGTPRDGTLRHTGALIAPFAFLGPGRDAQLTEAFTLRRGAQMSVHGLLAILVEALRAEQSIGVLENCLSLC